MEKWYRTDYFFGKYGDPIKIIYADKSSDKSIWINGQRNLIRTSSYSYFKTFDEAKKFLLDKWSKKIDSLKFSLRSANKTFDRIMDQQEK